MQLCLASFGRKIITNPIQLNQFGMAVLVRCDKSVWCDKSSTESAELLSNLT